MSEQAKRTRSRFFERSTIESGVIMAQRQRKAGRSARRKSSRKGLLWGVVIVIAVGAGLVAANDAGADHPKPRADAHEHRVAPASRYEGYPRVAQAYAHAADVKGTLDGVYCYCMCAEHSGHYSLLDCFRDDHAARCDVCMSEAELAWRMFQDGKTLDNIRDAVDGLYGG